MPSWANPPPWRWPETADVPFDGTGPQDMGRGEPLATCRHTPLATTDSASAKKRSSCFL
jgi:hypothetical protein